MATSHTLPLDVRVTAAAETAVIFLAGVAASFLASLAAWVIVPVLLLGWTPLVVVSGSMEPAIRVGDVVLVDPSLDSPVPGSVVAFDRDGSPVVHRVVTALASGSLTTQGDANPEVDPGSVGRQGLLGTARLVVPFVGLVRTVGWGWTALTAGLAVVGTRQWRNRPALAATMGSLALAAAVVAVASGTFITTSSTRGSALAAVDAEPPASLGASCGLVGADSIEVELSWAASPSPGLLGYSVLHDGPAAGTNFVEVGTTESTVTEFTHVITSPALGTHTYTVRADVGGWQSEDSITDAVSITQLVVFVCTEL